jgi:hypothetical protein
MVKNIPGNNQCINLVANSQCGNLIENPRLFGLARPARQFMPKMPIRCMQDLYKTASFVFGSNPRDFHTTIKKEAQTSFFNSSGRSGS